MNISLQDNVTAMVDDPSGGSGGIFGGGGGGSGLEDFSTNNNEEYLDDMFWVVMWSTSLILFILAPFCFNEQRRALCYRRIQERRWIPFTEIEDDDWYQVMMETRRRQALGGSGNGSGSGTNGGGGGMVAQLMTQEDEIREQFLERAMKSFTMTLSKSDIQIVDPTTGTLMVKCLSSNLDNDDISTKLVPIVKNDTDETFPSEANNDNNDNDEAATTTTVVEGTTTDNQNCTLGNDSHDAVEHDIENPLDTTALDDCEVGPSSTSSNMDTSQQEPTVTLVLNDTEKAEQNSMKQKSTVSDTFDDAESPELISVPLPGQPARSETDVDDDKASSNKIVIPENNSHCRHRRHVLNGCTICLTRFTVEEDVTWSSNPKCSHIFHYECLMNWFLAVGRKEQRRRQQQQQQNRGAADNDDSEWDQICTFPMLCPCCRQPFIVLPDNNHKSGSGGDITTSSTMESEVSHDATTTNSDSNRNGIITTTSTLNEVEESTNIDTTVLVEPQPGQEGTITEVSPISD